VNFWQLSPASKDRLETCHPALKAVVYRATELSPVDFTVLCGHRGEADQTAAVAAGTSKTPWPKSKHNSQPSRAVDLAPYPIDWKDAERFAILAGAILASAKLLGVEITWGGTWSTFKDRPHFELKDKELPIEEP
jgi:peptidoglycan L-alanyl-D-glutamate endopeptidase CwlK